MENKVKNHPKMSTQKGENNYQNDNCKIHQGYMPFMFKSKRQPMINKIDSPPIGTYNIASCFDKSLIDSQLQQSQQFYQQLNKKQQMSIFKSSLKRFKQPNIKENKFNLRQQYKLYQNKAYQQVQKQKQKVGKSVILYTKKSPPTIPDSRMKYGFTRTKDGDFKCVVKKVDELETQRQKMKTYSKGLKGQHKYSHKNILTTLQRNKQEQFEYKLNKIRQKSKLLNSFEQKNEKMQFNNSTILNEQRIKSNQHFKANINLKQKKQNSLGPGYYEMNLNTMNIKERKNKYEFFDSSEIRFKYKEKQLNTDNSNKNDFQEIKMNKILKIQKKKKQNKKIQNLKPLIKINKKQNKGNVIKILDKYNQINNNNKIINNTFQCSGFKIYPQQNLIQHQQNHNLNTYLNKYQQNYQNKKDNIKIKKRYNIIQQKQKINHLNYTCQIPTPWLQHNSNEQQKKLSI